MKASEFSEAQIACVLKQAKGDSQLSVARRGDVLQVAQESNGWKDSIRHACSTLHIVRSLYVYKSKPNPVTAQSQNRKLNRVLRASLNHRSPCPMQLEIAEVG